MAHQKMIAGHAVGAGALVALAHGGDVAAGAERAAIASDDDGADARVIERKKLATILSEQDFAASGRARGAWEQGDDPRDELQSTVKEQYAISFLTDAG